MEEKEMIMVNISCQWMEDRARDAMIATAAVEAFIAEVNTPTLGDVARASLNDMRCRMWEDIQVLQCVVPSWGEKCERHAGVGKAALERFSELYPRIMIAIGEDPKLPTGAYGARVEDPSAIESFKSHRPMEH